MEIDSVLERVEGVLRENLPAFNRLLEERVVEVILVPVILVPERGFR